MVIFTNRKRGRVSVFSSRKRKKGTSSSLLAVGRKKEKEKSTGIVAEPNEGTRISNLFPY